MSAWLNELSVPMIAGWNPAWDIYFHFDFFACFQFLTATRQSTYK